jgi:RimJ/RimL family protein N-acetyltransferase
MKFDSLKTERLFIRRLSKEDAQTMARYRSIPEVAEFQSWDSYSSDEAHQLIEQTEKSDPEIKGEWFQFGIEDSKTGDLIGDIGFQNTDDDAKSWVGFTLDSKHWGQGFATESVEKVISYYKDLGVELVCASIDPLNHSS